MTPEEVRIGAVYWARVNKRWAKVVVLGKYRVTYARSNGTPYREIRFQCRIHRTGTILKKLRLPNSLFLIDPARPAEPPADPRRVPWGAFPQDPYKP